MQPSAQESAFAAEVARHQAAAGVNQDWVGRQVNLSRSKISEICKGRFLPNRRALDNLIIALAMDRERAVELWRAAREGQAARRRADKMAQHPPPEGWTALPVLPAEIQSLLRAQIQVAQELPYRLPGARRPSLAMVYVRQGLGSGGDEPQQEQPRPEPMWDDREPLRLPDAPTMRLTVRPPPRTIWEALDSHDHLVITGGPGQGKSTLSLRLAADIAARWMTPTNGAVSPAEQAPLAEPVVPLRLSARELALRLDLPSGQALAASVAKYGARLSRDVSAQTLAGRVVGCRWLLLIDGLDEVADSAVRDQLVNVLAVWASDPAESPYRVVLTTRPFEGAALAPLLRVAAAYELQPFDEEALRLFAEHWFAEEGGDTAHRFLRQLREAQLDELVGVPLLATIAAIIFEQRDDRPLPDNQYELYEAYLEYLRSARTDVAGPFEPLGTDLLEHLGRVRVTTDAPLVTAARSWVAEHMATKDLSPSQRDELTRFLANLGPLHFRADELEFLHHSFAEHVAATAEARLLPEQFDPEHDGFADLLHAARQKVGGRHSRAVLLHHTRLHPAQADRLVRWLHHGSADQQRLAAWLLTRHVPVGAQVVDAFLDTVREWAMTTQYVGWRILRRVSRAAHHPGMDQWLAGLMDEQAAPWRSRVEAATALATRLRRGHTDEATAVLRTIMDDEAVPVENRLTAAEGLAQCAARVREAAERGLCALLANPAATAFRRRSAAVILAGLGPSARDHAVAALLESLDDPQAPVQDLVESATGLAEIGIVYHERSAEVFGAVLRSRAHTMVGRKDAATGLAALGPHHLAEAVAALTDLVTDQGFDYFDRASAAQALVELGPQYRAVAGGHLLDMLAEPGLKPNERRRCASVLTELGPDFHPQAATHLRQMIADRETNSTVTVLAIESLADLGPAFHAEAAQELRRLAADPLVDGYARAYTLGQLARLGAPHRALAVDRFRTELGDRSADPATRRWMASELVKLGTEFHAEAATALLDIISGQPDPEVVADAWGTLTTLGTQFRQPAAEALLAVLGSPTVGVLTLNKAARELATLGPEYRQQAADALVGVLADETRNDWPRALIARGLVQLGRQFHGIAVDGFVGLLRRGPGLDLRLLRDVDAFVTVGAGPRKKITETVHALMSDPNAGSDQRGKAARALVQLGGGNQPEVVAALRAVATDKSADPTDRRGAAVALARLAPDCTPEAIAALRDIATSTHRSDTWEAAVLALARIGDDPVSLARDLIADQDTNRMLREIATSVLSQLRQDLVSEAIAELRRQAQDEYLSFWDRTDVVVHLADLDDSTRDDAITFHQVLLDDEDEQIKVRCYAAYQLVQLDRTYWRVAVATLRRLSANRLATPADHQVTTAGLTRLNALRPGEAARSALAVAYHPAAHPAERWQVIETLSGPVSLDVQRTLLNDHAVPVKNRVPSEDGRDRPLVAEAEAAVREVLTAIESSPAERVNAAATLADLSPRLVPEAERALENLSLGGDQAALRALVALVQRGRKWWRRARDTVARMTTDKSLSQRERHYVVDLVDEIDTEWHTEWGPEVLDFLREVASDERTSEVRRFTALFALRRIDGFGSLRALRDDERALPIIRCGAAMVLRSYTVEDRAASVQVLDSIANDTTARPALRGLAAQVLAQLGVRGRNRAADALRSIAADNALLVTARAEAARLLAQIQPSRFAEALTVLRGLVNVGKPLHRRQVLLALGALDTTKAVPPLRAMAHDRALGPVVRLRCAEALAQLRRDQRETASIVARELMRDEAVPHHVRSRAARDLARWSELCREEARDMLRALGSGQRP